MNPDPTMKSTPDPGPPEDAERPSQGQPVGASKVAAEGDVGALRPKLRPTTGAASRVVGGLHVIAPPGRHSTARAYSWCACGRDEWASGRDAVLRLITAHRAHATVCPAHHPQEGRAAA